MKTKNNKAIILLTSIVCLLPLILSAVVYNDLPEQIAVQWSAGGNPQNYVPKAAAAFGLPFLFMAINIFSNVRLLNDPKKVGASQTARMIMLWVVPFASLVLMPVSLFFAMGVMIPVTVVIPLILGIVFILYGNYLPKNRRNYVIGYKIPWTFNNADNWNKAHRLAGYLWIFGGIGLIVQAFATFENTAWLILSLLIVVMVVLVPIIYSYALYKKTAADERHNEEEIS